MRTEHSTDKRISYRTGLAASVTLGLTLVATLALAGASAPDPQAARSGVVAATVGEEPIDASEVARLLKAATRERKVSPAALPVLQAQALAEIVDRRLVLAYARRTREYPKDEEIGAAAADRKSVV